MTLGALVGGALLGGCPTPIDDPDADLDAARVRLDAHRDDAYLDPTTDAYLLDVYDPTVDAPIGTDSNLFPIDAGRPDAGMIDQCEGEPTPPSPCTNDDECREMGFSRCVLPVVGPSTECMPCTVLIDECRTDMDCFVRATTDAGGPVSDEDAAMPGADAGPMVDPSSLVCNTYNAGCACPMYVCEPRCTGADCPDSSCADDGYVCPSNSTCAPSDPMADDHGCAPNTCTTTADCDCGFCTGLGLCARGAGRCE